jgi:hypothetical protein
MLLPVAVEVKGDRLIVIGILLEFDGQAHPSSSSLLRARRRSSFVAANRPTTPKSQRFVGLIAHRHGSAMGLHSYSGKARPCCEIPQFPTKLTQSSGGSGDSELIAGQRKDIRQAALLFEERGSARLVSSACSVAS